MKILSTLLAVSSTLTTLVAAEGCYGSGHRWYSANNARYHLGRACRGYDGHGGAFSGVFGPGETRCACVNSDADSDSYYVFMIRNQNPNQGFDLNDEDCLNNGRLSIDECMFGGETTNSGWLFRSDPQRGRCITSTACS